MSSAVHFFLESADHKISSSSTCNIDRLDAFTMASLFKQLSEDMERIAQVVEEGAKFMMGESTLMGERGNDETFDPAAGGDHGYNGEDGDAIFKDVDGMDGDYGSPLMGMADSVMSDVMSNQVGTKILLLAYVIISTSCNFFTKCGLPLSDHSIANL